MTSAQDEQSSALFFAIHAKGLRGLPYAAIKFAVEVFLYDDPRAKNPKTEGDVPFFPQPHELRDIAKAEADSIRWRNEQAIKLRHQAEALKNAPAALVSPKASMAHAMEKLSEGLSELQVLRMCRYIAMGYTDDDARAKAVEEIAA